MQDRQQASKSNRQPEAEAAKHEDPYKPTLQSGLPMRRGLRKTNGNHPKCKERRRNDERHTQSRQEHVPDTGGGGQNGDRRQVPAAIGVRCYQAANHRDRLT